MNKFYYSTKYVTNIGIQNQIRLFKKIKFENAIFK